MREDDLTLLRRYATTRAEDAFSELVRRNMDAVYSAALRRVGGDAHLARDVAQEVFVVLSRRAAQLRDHPVLAAWLYTTTRNIAVNLVRSERRRKAREQEAQSMHDTFTQPERPGDWQDIAPYLDDAVDRLNETDRRVVILRFFERHTFVEIGAMLRVTEDAARMRADRAIDKLRRRLATRGIQSSSAALGSVLAQHAVSAAPAGLTESAIQSAATAPPVETALSVNSFGWSLIVSGITIIGSLAIVVHERGSRQSLAAAVQQEEQRIQTLEHQATGFQPSAASIPSSAPAGNSTPPERIAQRSVRMIGGRKLALSVIYADFYRQLGFSQERIDRFERINLQGPGDGVWIAEVSPDSIAGSPSVSPTLSPTEVVAQLQDLLGAAAFEQYQDYRRLVPARTIAAQLAGAVYLTDPISSHQADQLIRILTDASAAYQAGGPIERSQLNWNAIIAGAQAVFNSSQMDALEAVRRQDEFERAMLHEIKIRANETARAQR